MEQQLALYTHHLIYGALGLIALLLGIYGHIYRMWILPTKNWRKEKETEHTELKHEFDLFKQRVENDLERGDVMFEKLEKKIDNLDSTIDCLTKEIIKFRSSLENGLRNTVMRGIGEPE